MRGSVIRQKLHPAMTHKAQEQGLMVAVSGDTEPDGLVPQVREW